VHLGGRLNTGAVKAEDREQEGKRKVKPSIYIIPTNLDDFALSLSMPQKGDAPLSF